jgi:glycine/D-amino acid oxidase-like deaminating enzyme
VRPTRGHASIYDVTPYQYAVVDEIRGIDGLYLAVGFAARASRPRPAAGAAMLEMILEGKPAAAIAPFSYMRFVTGKLISGDASVSDGLRFRPLAFDDHFTAILFEVIY